MVLVDGKETEAADSRRPSLIGVRMLAAGPRREQSQAEEIANSISHGIGLVAAFVGTPFLTSLMRHSRERVHSSLARASLSATIIFLYLASTLYHALPISKAKRIFRIIEHSAIFLLIAGTYTLFTLGVLRGPWGWALFGLIWGLAIAGVALKVLYWIRPPIPCFLSAFIC